MIIEFFAGRTDSNGAISITLPVNLTKRVIAITPWANSQSEYSGWMTLPYSNNNPSIVSVKSSVKSEIYFQGIAIGY